MEKRGFEVVWGVMVAGACLAAAILTGAPADAAAAGTAEPAWAAELASDIEPPSKLSEEGRQTCEARVLAALNQQFELKLEPSDIAPVRAPSWANEERGFIRGGGYNIRISVTGLSAKEVTSVRSGRYEGEKNDHHDSLVSSLHVPGKVNGVETFSEGAGSLDFTAHLDSAYAYTPWGAIDHLIVDVIGSDTRDPCPATGEP